MKKDSLINELDLTLFGAGIALFIVSAALSPTNPAQLYIVFAGAVVWFICAGFALYRKKWIYFIGTIFSFTSLLVVLYKLW